jgi:predicted nucleic acid-binding protein
MQVIVDTCVLIDMLLKGRPRHLQAERLREVLQSRGVKVRVPLYGLFELAAAMKQEFASPTGGTLQINRAISKLQPLEFEFAPIDQAFFQKYYSSDLPTMKAGDLVFLAMAKTEGTPLITEDDSLYSEAKAAGVVAYRIEECIAAMETDRQKSYSAK